MFMHCHPNGSEKSVLQSDPYSIAGKKPVQKQEITERERESERS